MVTELAGAGSTVSLRSVSVAEIHVIVNVIGLGCCCVYCCSVYSTYSGVLVQVFLFDSVCARYFSRAAVLSVLMF